VVDGWALTMLQRRNVSLASTCNSVGQTTGYFLGYVIFLGLESPEFCNAYLRSNPLPHGIVTLPGFLYFWGIVFLLLTTNNGIQERILHNRAQLGSCTNLPLVVEYYPVTGDTHDRTDTSYEQSWLQCL